MLHGFSLHLPLPFPLGLVGVAAGCFGGCFGGCLGLSPVIVGAGVLPFEGAGDCVSRGTLVGVFVGTLVGTAVAVGALVGTFVGALVGDITGTATVVHGTFA